MPIEAFGRILEVGPDHQLKSPSAAAAAARDGDTIQIEPGDYVDCAVWAADRLTIVGKGQNTVLTRKVCEDKAIFVIRGQDVTIRNLTFSGARATSANGAGIRAEGRNLTVERSRFVDNENGILSVYDPQSTIHIVESEFLRNGSCEQACAHGVYINAGTLRIERSKFIENKIGHHIKSRAALTELIGNEIRDGETGTTSYLVDIPNGGAVLMEGNVLEKGRLTSNPIAAVVIGAEGVKHPTPKLIFKTNNFFSNVAGITTFVRNLTDTDAVLEQNQISGEVIPLSGKGSVH